MADSGRASGLGSRSKFGGLHRSWSSAPRCGTSRSVILVGEALDEGRAPQAGFVHGGDRPPSCGTSAPAGVPLAKGIRPLGPECHRPSSNTAPLGDRVSRGGLSMTKDASFKKVVRRHAEETGQRYTEALTDLKGLGARMHHVPVPEQLLAHLRDRYGIDPVAATRLTSRCTIAVRPCWLGAVAASDQRTAARSETSPAMARAVSRNWSRRPR
jgi:hypothetical protein